MPGALSTPRSDLGKISVAKKMKHDYDQANRSHLTRAPGLTNSKPDFKTTFRKEFPGIKEFDLDHQTKIKELKNFLSSTTYSIGRKSHTSQSQADNFVDGLKTPRVMSTS
jgi:hypothetical protein